MILGSGIRQQIARMLGEGLTVEQIAASLELPVEVVAIESERSTKRGSSENSAAKEALLRYQDAALATLGDLAENAENEGVKAKCAMYIADTAFGLKDPKKVEANNSMTQINILIQQAQEAYMRQIKSVTVESQAEILKLN